ncbi:hypothetical protein GCM10011396_49670 [Undibacterium terreum]|uniref:site-specific DNA-methyltransferase (adenine-specific) n=2 Tax=Undibacterium terreum TaxID=1224302 RepID=A0A916XRL2_9BURK|nr:hypothetical protein GCM10011396_49670 [Undibacterium terreum]
MNLAPPKYERYIEPFAGSASLYFELMPIQAIVADVNPCVIDVYQAIKSDADAVSDMLDSIPRTREAYYSLRALSPISLTIEQRAARLIFLMKACFNGVYRTNRRGQFNVPMGDKIYALPSRDELLFGRRTGSDNCIIRCYPAGTFLRLQCRDAAKWAKNIRPLLAVDPDYVPVFCGLENKFRRVNYSA